MYALTLNENSRILSATYDQYAQPGDPIVESLPDGDITGYLYRDGQYIYDPLPDPEPTPAEQAAELKKKLADTDYIVIKIAEGVATWDDYPGMREQRQEWRERIRELENEEE